MIQGMSVLSSGPPFGGAARGPLSSGGGSLKQSSRQAFVMIRNVCHVLQMPAYRRFR